MGRSEGKQLRIKTWYEKPVRGIGVNIWAPDWYHASITHFDAEKLADSIAESGADVGLTFQGFTQDHFGISCFPTGLGPRHRNLNGHDNILEYTEALHKRGIKIFGYYSFPDKHVWQQDPDWRQLDSEGNELKHGSWGGDLCANSPYRDHFIRRTCEIARNYEIDGFLVDSAGFYADPLSCYCPYCQRKYRESFGTDIPKGSLSYSPEWRRFIQWRYECMEEFYDNLRTALKAVKPNIVLTHNAFGVALWVNHGFSVGEHRERIFEYDDVTTSIACWNAGQARHIDQIWKTGLLTRVMRGLSGKPAWVQVGRFPYDRDYQIMPLHELKLIAYSIIANGGSPFYIDNLYPDGSIDDEAFKRMGIVYKEVEGKLGNLDFEKELDFAALLFSVSSQDFSDLAYPGEKRYLSSFQGAYKALLEGHIPFQVIGEDGLNEQDLSRFKVVIIPDCTVMSETQVNNIKSYVNMGGGLLCTGKT